MSKADLNRVKNLVESIVNADDLDVLELCELSLHHLIAPNRLKESTVAVGRELQLTVGLEHDLAIRIHSWQHSLWEENERRFTTAKVIIGAEEFNGLIVVLM